ncbi:metalloregulator ArsR/SmtB family transcription factor [Actinomadura sp. NEAU-AAG7]|uniref:metalloregulator ArsR/SmtB family transcription factor n=1 Tax=Actinomadura sp. NEAU-AAG7 TaxID=2839640 RepID=UPI001BE40FC6|nr:metalloregulator ArsR/SmtB family transcription factor [Actinomadura sp. NEAU-AAG7]MBT2210838.1 helix-turn-helix domain-containing protein [Actinomadura sp. NEAU-AAG7]
MAAEVTDVFAAFASPVRLELTRLLLEGPRSVNELAAHFEMSRPSVSEHLRVLRTAGLVTERRDGRRRVYRLEPGPLMDVSDWLTPYERFWRERLADLRDVLDEEHPE